MISTADRLTPARRAIRRRSASLGATLDGRGDQPDHYRAVALADDPVAAARGWTRTWITARTLP